MDKLAVEYGEAHERDAYQCQEKETELSKRFGKQRLIRVAYASS